MCQVIYIHLVGTLLYTYQDKLIGKKKADLFTIDYQSESRFA